MTRAPTFQVRADNGFQTRSSSEIVRMNTSKMPELWLVRHGETEWTVSRRHTGLTNIPLTLEGEAQAKRLQNVLKTTRFAAVFCSPLQRARRTCELAGFSDSLTIAEDLVEWDYGDYEGKKRPEILAQRPDWVVFRDGCPNGESPIQVAERADRVIERVRTIDGDTVLFSSGHFLRALLARWLGYEASAGRHFKLGTGAISVLGYDHQNQLEPVVRFLNLSPTEPN